MTAAPALHYRKDTATPLRHRRTLDATSLTAIANHPDVRPFLGGTAVLDLAALVEDPANITMETAHGGLICIAIGAGRYDVHTLFLPEGRGGEAYDAMCVMADYMFSVTDCTEGRTTVPSMNRGAALAARRAGFELRYTSELPWGDSSTAAEFLALTIERWALRSPMTLALGQWFHETLTEAKKAARSAQPAHADDPVHDHIVGAVGAMARGGQPEKAVRFYNVWAACARYAPIQLLRAHPIIIDVQDAIVEWSGTELEVLRCR